VRIELYVEGEWCAPIEPPPIWKSKPLQAYKEGFAMDTSGVEVRHPALGEIVVRPSSFPIRIVDEAA
jgi:hypothetical protein